MSALVEGRCGSCKHWGEDRTFSMGSKVELRECDAIPASGCTVEPQQTHGLAITTDGDDWSSSLYTTAEFGCVLWEKGEDA